ncbi:ABC transporter permease [Gordonia insulae]|uniref:ABC transporter permease n=1 Tax=Gordonia insulae TaxID=2420509 RepID=UPI000F5BA434|nr:ABC transporter permease subunit [Gordonia insulae]
MTTTETRPAGSRPARLGWWRPVRIIAGLELRQRIRATRWRISLAVMFAVVTAVVFGSFYFVLTVGGSTYREWSANLYAIVVALVLFLGVIISPTLTATAINGDRRDATLAVVQATPITNWQLATGKFLGSWVASMTLLVVALPYVLWGIVCAPFGVASGFLGVVLVMLIFACYCGVGLGFSALTARPAGSAILTQGTVLFLLLGLPALFGLLYPAVSRDHQVTVASYGPYDPGLADRDPGYYPPCRDVEETRAYHHTERTWWLLAPNPFLMVADAVGRTDPPNWTYIGTTTSPETTRFSVARPIAEAQSTARAGPFIEERTCAEADFRLEFGPNGTETSYWERKRAHESSFVGASWYIGLIVNLAIGGAGFLIAARRLRVPAGKLPRGVRIA